MTTTSTNLLRRRVRQAADLASWRTAALDLGWRLRGSCPPPEPGVSRSRFVVRWPRDYRQPDAERFVGPLLRGLSELATVEPVEMPQPWDLIVTFHLLHEGAVHPIAIDYADATRLNEACADSVALYFKFQYL